MDQAPTYINELLDRELVPTLEALGFSFQKELSSENSSVFVGQYYQIKIFWDWRGELTFSASNSSGDDWVPLSMMIGENDSERRLAQGIMFVGGSVHPVAAVQQLAGLLQRHSEVLTLSNNESFPKLVAQWRNLMAENNRNERLFYALKAARALWRSKQYSDFIAVLSDWENDLSPAMNAKLQFAKSTVD